MRTTKAIAKVLAWFVLAGTSAFAQEVGQPAPDIQWRTTLHFDTAPATKLSDLRGSVVLLEFWATWCGPCRAMIPKLNTLHAEKADQGLVIVGLSSEQDAVVQAFLEKTRMDYPIALAMSPGYQVTGIPHSFLIGTDGRLLWRGHPATLDHAEIDKALVGACSAFVAAGLGEVHALRKQQEFGAAYLKAKDLLAAGGLGPQATAQATRWADQAEAEVRARTAAADAAEAAKDPYQVWLQLEPMALRYHGVPGAQELAKRYATLMADARNKREIEAGKQLVAAQELESANDFDGAHTQYKALVGSHGNTAAGKKAAEAMKEIERLGKLGYQASCGYCRASGAACATHRRKKK
jgi:thiol-disulfide isomerase/thioredoxin